MSNCLNQPLPPYPLEAWLEFTVDGVSVRSAQAVQTVQHVVGRGGVYQPLLIAPAVSVAATATAGIIPLDGDKGKTATRQRSCPQQCESVRSRLRCTWICPRAGSPRLNRSPLRPTKRVTSRPSPSRSRPSNLAAASYSITPVAEYQGHQYAQGYETVGYPGLRPYNYYQPGPYKLVGVDVKLAPGLKVGYVMGTGDEVPQALESMGVAVHLLQAADINDGNLVGL